LPPLRTLGLWAALAAASAAVSYGLMQAQFPAALLLGPMIAAIAFGVGDLKRLPQFCFHIRNLRERNAFGLRRRPHI